MNPNSDVLKNIKILKANINEVEVLQKIGKQTFHETFAGGNTVENMSEYLQDTFSIEKITNELNNQHSEFYIAVLEDQTIGYLKVNFQQAQTELKDANSLEIERIYVLKEFHGQKVGQLLYQKAIQIAKSNMLKYVWLGVWDQNPRAINFYKKNGFIELDKHVFKLGNDEQTDLLMRLEIVG
ncbi:MAG TPA: GNAT family N-acetyltransferase [Flavitalea sp.]|nr:GNAT family N-acetyltransferase [Flavitalea sp.]